MFFFPLSDQNPTKNKPIICWIIITICIILFFWQQTLSNENQGKLILSFGMIPSVIFGFRELSYELILIPSELTIFTSIFLHGGWMHLIGNMMYLYIFGDNIEDCMGKFRFIIFFGLCGVIAALSQSYVNLQSPIPMIGASGAVSGVLGGYLLLFPKAKIRVFFWFLIFIKIFNVPSLIVLGGWLLIQFFSFDLNSSDSNIAYAAHIGGFISGMIFIKIFKKKGYNNLSKLGKGSVPKSS